MNCRSNFKIRNFVNSLVFSLHNTKKSILEHKIFMLLLPCYLPSVVTVSTSLIDVFWTMTSVQQ